MKKFFLSLFKISIFVNLFSQASLYPPTLVAPANNQKNANVAVLFDWSSVAGANEYELQVSQDDAFSNVQFLIKTKYTAHQINNLDYNAKYYWRVRALGTNNQTSNWSETRNLTTSDKVKTIFPYDSIVPGKIIPEKYIPRNDSVVLKTKKDTILITISNLIDTFMVANDTVFIEYKDTLLYASVINSDTILFNKKANNQEQIEFVLDPFEKEYILKVSDYLSPINITLFGNKYTLKPFDTIPEQKLPDDTLKYNFNLATHIKWSLIAGSKYEVQIDVVNTFDSENLKSYITSNKDTLIGKVDFYGRGYYYRVRAFHDTDTSNWSDVKYFSTKKQPTLFSPANKAANISVLPTLSWDALAGSTNCEYVISLDSTLNNAKTINVGYSFISIEKPTSLKDRLAVAKIKPDTLLFNKTYYWQARCQTKKDVSQWSSVFNFKTVQTVILDKPANNAENISLTPRFEWRNIDGIKFYELEYSINKDFSNSSKARVTPGSAVNASYTPNEKLLASKVYYWRVRAIAKDTSDWSQVYSFKTTSATDITEKSPFKINIYPTPSCQEFINIEINADVSTNYAISLSNILGQEIKKKEGLLFNGLNKITLDVSNQAEGVYFITVKTNDYTLTKKIIIQK